MKFERFNEVYLKFRRMHFPRKIAYRLTVLFNSTLGTVERGKNEYHRTERTSYITSNL